MTTIVLTGPSRGVGRATSLALVAKGCRLVLLGRASDAMEAVAGAARAARGDVNIIDVDLADPLGVERAAAHVLERAGAPDVLINNAGIIERSAVVETTLDSWNRQLSVNLTAPFVLTRALLPAMLDRRRGRIINIGSISSTLGTADAAAYCASKWGLVGLTKSLAKELSDTGLMAVAILPGSVDTRMLQGSGFEPRMTPEDVAKTIAYFALDAPLAHNGAAVEMFGV